MPIPQGANDRDDGCTAAAMVIREQDLYLGHVGDSRAVLFRNGECMQLSNDHKPNIPEERERIEKMGGVVIWAGTWRVGGVLAVSRAFGDRLLKDFVVARPDLRHEKLGAGDVAVVLVRGGEGAGDAWGQGRECRAAETGRGLARVRRRRTASGT